VARHGELAPLATVVRAFRKAAGYTQERFAYDAQLDRGFLGAVEHAERNVGFRKMRHLLIGVGVTWREFGAALHGVDPLPAYARRAGGSTLAQAESISSSSS
jgi:transcriptional regulator with XRE-family HTH domain